MDVLAFWRPASAKQNLKDRSLKKRNASRFLRETLRQSFEFMITMDHFTVVCLVAWPLNESEAGVDLVFIETSLLLLCKFLLISPRTASLT